MKRLNEDRTWTEGVRGPLQDASVAELLPGRWHRQMSFPAVAAGEGRSGKGGSV